MVSQFLRNFLEQVVHRIALGSWFWYLNEQEPCEIHDSIATKFFKFEKEQDQNGLMIFYWSPGNKELKLNCFLVIALQS